MILQKFNDEKTYVILEHVVCPYCKKTGHSILEEVEPGVLEIWCWKTNQTIEKIDIGKRKKIDIENHYF